MSLRVYTVKAVALWLAHHSSGEALFFRKVIFPKTRSPWLPLYRHSPNALPDKILKGPERDHSAHSLTRWSERVVQQNIADTSYMSHAIVVEVGGKGHSKQ